MKKDELSSELAKQWWGSLTPAEKEVIKSLMRPLITNQKTSLTTNERTHQSHASGKAANLGLLGDMLSKSNESKSDKRLGLTILYLRTHQKLASTIYEELFGENLVAVNELWAAFNHHDSIKYASLVDKDCTWHRQDGHKAISSEKVQESIEFYIQAFSDIRFDTKDIVATGDLVVTKWTATGTHDGEFMGIPATGKSLKVVGSTIHKLRGGKVVEMWDYWDLNNLLVQLGLVMMKFELPSGKELTISVDAQQSVPS